MKRVIRRYLSWMGLFIIGILVYLVILDWRLFSAALAVTGIVAIVLAVLADSAHRSILVKSTRNLENKAWKQGENGDR